MLGKLTKEQVALRTDWVEALRSGKYKQACGRLRSDKGYCCLGVAADVLSGDGWDERDALGDYRWRNSYSSLPSSAEVDFGLDSRVVSGFGNGAPVFVGGTDVSDWDLLNTLMYMNDTAEFTFDEIADVIELDTIMRQEGAI